MNRKSRVGYKSSTLQFKAVKRNIVKYGKKGKRKKPLSQNETEGLTLRRRVSIGV